MASPIFIIVMVIVGIILAIGHLATYYLDTGNAG